MSAPATAPAAILTRHGRVGVITLNRPDALNAANAALSLAVGEALEEIAADDELRVAVLTGTGRGFCAGMDLKAFARPASRASSRRWPTVTTGATTPGGSTTPPSRRS